MQTYKNRSGMQSVDAENGGGAAASPERVSGGGWRSAIFVIAVEIGERFAYYGISGNLMMYLTRVLHQTTAVAAKNVNAWNGVFSLSLIVGAFFADSYLGRFRATIISACIFLLGLSLLTVSVSGAIPDKIQPAIFFLSLYITAIGDGGHRPSLQTFAADQFDEFTPEQKQRKSSFFNWWFLGIVMGSMTATLVVVYIQDNVSWVAGFAIPTGVEVVAFAVFLIGIRTYRRNRPVGSPFTRVAQVLVAAVRKRNVPLRDAGSDDGVVSLVECSDDGGSELHLKGRRLTRTEQFRWLDKAAIPDSSTKTINPWRLTTFHQVEEVKLILRLFPIWLCTLAYAIIVAQVHTFFIKQADTMNRTLISTFTIPPGCLPVIPGFTILTIIPIYDKLFVPFCRRLTGIPSGITTLTRIGIGLALSILTIIVAALVERKRINVATEHGLLDSPKAMVPIRVWIMAPQFLIMGMSDFFTYVGMQELFYDQMPEDMRSMGSAFTNAAIGVGALMSTVVISVVQGISQRFGGDEVWLVDNLNRAHLDRFYWVLAVLGGFVLVVYVGVARWFVLQKG